MKPLNYYPSLVDRYREYNKENKMTDQKSANEPGSGQRQGGGDSPATQPSRGDKDSHPTGQGGDKGGNTPQTPSSNPSGPSRSS
jgi:hypothetical protein